MKIIPQLKLHWQHLLLLLLCLSTLHKVNAKSDDFKVINKDGFINFYEAEGNDSDDNREMSLVVWAKDGSKVAFALSKRPKVTFSGTDLMITGKDFEAVYPLDNMARFTYEMVDITVIKDIKTDNFVFKFAGESLIFPALKANNTVSIYTLSGTLVFNKTVQNAGEYSFPLSSLNAGVYIVNVNGLTYKIAKR